MIVGGDGHFRYSDGSRARFWGINVSSTRLNIPNDQIERAVDNFAHAGLNMVRLEAIDNRNCLLGSVDAPDSRHFDPALSGPPGSLDGLPATARHLLLSRPAGLSHVQSRRWRSERRQLDRARASLCPVRPLPDRTAKRVCLATAAAPKSAIPACARWTIPPWRSWKSATNTAFFCMPEKLETLVEPYRSDLRSRWAQWLKAKYGSREKLAATWGSINVCPSCAMTKTRNMIRSISPF